jgi:AmmeMemoRadiSam system protein A
MSIDKGQILLPLARNAIARQLGQPAGAAAAEPWLQEPGATFVTLTQAGELRGCIGSLQAHRTLLDDVQANAVAAAFQDPRFSPLNLTELSYTRVEVSLLSPSETIVFESEQHALAQLRPDIDGVIFEYGYYRSTFLPQVWEQLPDPEIFMAHLKRKAGLAPNFWAANVKLARYTVSKWKEPAGNTEQVA